MYKNYPAYLRLYESGKLKKRIDQAYNILKNCILCPNQCKINRFQEQGFCRSRDLPQVSSFNPHHGEEPPVSGIYGSGTVFFTNCTMKCVFCQNYPISQLGTGKTILVEELAETFLYLQQKKCHNLNLVTPTHFMPQFLKALYLAVQKGFHLPVVYNTNGYETLQALKLLDNIVDIYLPDMKYGSDENAFQYSGVKNYVRYNQKAIKEMYRQAGDLQTDRDGIAVRGVIIRHLVLPYNLADSKKILDFLKELSLTITIGIMAQYFPAYKAVDDRKLKYRITREEYQEIVDYAVHLGLKNILCQEV